MNKMTASNIGIVIGPNLLWPPGDNRCVCFTCVFCQLPLHTYVHRVLFMELYLEIIYILKYFHNYET